MILLYVLLILTSCQDVITTPQLKGMGVLESPKIVTPGCKLDTNNHAFYPNDNLIFEWQYPIDTLVCLYWRLEISKDDSFNTIIKTEYFNAYKSEYPNNLGRQIKGLKDKALYYWRLKYMIIYNGKWSPYSTTYWFKTL